MSESSSFACLRTAALTRGLDDGAVSELVAATQTVRIQDGGTLFVQDDPAANLYLLHDGRIKISQLTPTGDQIVMRYLGSGDMFGCMVLSGMLSYPATANAIGDCSVLRWSKKVMGELLEEHPLLATNTLTTVGIRMRELQERLGELANERVEQRIARTVLRLVVQAGERAEDGIRIGFPILRQDIADMTGTTLHTVSRTMSSWESHGLAKLGRRRVTVTDMDGVAYIGGGDNISPQAA
ncbi:MAG: Crp/Fnr family transcriptional regulator [Rhodospirillaceae bacterium]|nr:Crp/Fnr family transcriptional regulator [Rhodospirillaceae bacterium]MBT6513038.1 Crp/Fnr family transcriptional regulator [Rhodospirillaceae bacterium]MBT7615211.1 Crp/Fnr family transcriptional regulator [Rhodospirillaceae bacterium]